MTTFAYAANAIVSVADKYVLNRPVRNPTVFAFYVGVLGLVFLLAAPFVLTMPSLPVLGAALASGSFFTVSLVALFRVLKDNDASRAIPIYGSILPIATLMLAWIFVGETLGLYELLAIGVLVLSGAILALSRRDGESGALSIFYWSAIAAVLFAAATVLARYVFLHHTFLSGFVWTRIGGGAAALLFLLFPGFVRALREARKFAPPRTDLLVIGVRILAGIAFISLHYAISLAPVTIINALKGIEYAFVFVLVLLMSRFLPHIVHEHATPRLVAVKLLAIGGIIVGLWLLSQTA